jgi:hypothetical protein
LIFDTISYALRIDYYTAISWSNSIATTIKLYFISTFSTRSNINPVTASKLCRAATYYVPAITVRSNCDIT